MTNNEDGVTAGPGEDNGVRPQRSEPLGTTGGARSSPGPTRKVTRVPSLAWLVCLVLLGVAALVGQGWGLRTLMDFSTTQAEWTATQKQRESLIAAWGEELQKHQSAAQQAREEAEKARKELGTAQAGRDAASTRLAGVLKDLSVQQKSRDQAVAEKAAAEVSTTTLRQASQDLQAEVTKLRDSKRGLEGQIAKFNQDANQQANAAAKLGTRVAALQAERQTAEKARDDADHNRIAEQRRMQQAIDEAQDFLKRRDEARRVLEDAEAKYAKLKTQLDQKVASDAEIDRLTAASTELRKTKTSLQDTVTTLDEQVAAKKKFLATATGELAAMAEKRQTAEGEITTLQAALAKLKGETEAARAARDKAVQEQATVQKTVEALREQQVGLVSVVRSLATAAIRSLKATTQPTSRGASGKE